MGMKSLLTELPKIALMYKSASKSWEQEIEFSNSMEYAVYLNAKEGYFVFNPEHALKTIIDTINATISAGLPMTYDNVALSLEASGWKELNWLRSYIGEAHVGNWKDRSFLLMRAYRFNVNKQGEAG